MGQFKGSAIEKTLLSEAGVYLFEIVEQYGFYSKQWRENVKVVKGKELMNSKKESRMRCYYTVQTLICSNFKLCWGL